MLDYFASDESAPTFLEHLKIDEYRPFNLLVGDVSLAVPEVYFITNCGPETGAATRLSSGLHAFGNGLRHPSWPKLDHGKRLFAEILASSSDGELAERLFGELLSDKQKFPEPMDALVPSGPQVESCISYTATVGGAKYGTRSTSVILVDNNDVVEFYTRSFDLVDPGDERIAFQITPRYP